MWVLLGVGVFGGVFVGRWFSENRVLSTLQQSVDRVELRTSLLAETERLLPQAGIPRNYLYLDSTKALGLYAQLHVAGELPVSREIEHRKERSRSLGAAWRGLSGSGSGTQGRKDTSLFQAEDNPFRAVASAEKSLLANNMVRDLNFTSEPQSEALDRYLQKLSREARELGFDVPDEAVSALERQWKAQQLVVDVKLLAEVRGYIRIRAKFEVRQAVGDDLQLVATHQSEDSSIKVIMHCRLDDMLVQSKEFEPHILAVCFGAVLGWDAERATLRVLPVSLFSA